LPGGGARRRGQREGQEEAAEEARRPAHCKLALR
jgi:hypothetical protein